MSVLPTQHILIRFNYLDKSLKTVTVIDIVSNNIPMLWICVCLCILKVLTLFLRCRFYELSFRHLFNHDYHSLEILEPFLGSI